MNKKDNHKSKIYNAIKDKVLISNISHHLVDVVRKLPEEIEDGKVLFDGLMLFDGIDGIEDDIQQMTSYTKDRKIVNLEDYYTENGAFEDDGKERFIAALKNLMTLKDYKSWIFRDIKFGDKLSTKDGNTLIFLTEKDGLYYCGLSGCSETIPYGFTGKCQIAELMGKDLSDGKLDVDLRVDYHMNINDIYTVDDLSHVLKSNIEEKLIDPDAVIIVNQEYGIEKTYCWDGNFHIVTQRLPLEETLLST